MIFLLGIPALASGMFVPNNGGNGYESDENGKKDRANDDESELSGCEGQCWSGMGCCCGLV